MNLLKAYHGPIVEESTTGLKMQESIARIVGEQAKQSSNDKQFAYCRVAKAASDVKLDDGERTDVSFVTTDAVDREGEVVDPSGANLKDYNRVVTFAHDYSALPVGTNLWLKREKNGLIGKTRYAMAPESWKGDWLPDAILALMRQDTCTGKSIGFLPTKGHEPTPDEIRKNPNLAECYWVHDEWKLLEYAVAPVPCNPEAEMIAVAKSVGGDWLAGQLIAAAKLMGAVKIPQADEEPPKIESPAEPVEVLTIPPFVLPATIRDAIRRRQVSAIDRLESKALQLIEDHLDRAAGRV